MNKVLIDYQIFSAQEFGGISRYHLELFERLDNCLIGAISSNNYYVNRSNKIKELYSNRLLHLNRKSRAMSLLNKMYVKMLLKNNNFNVFHPTYYDTYFLKDLKKPFVVTIHDMIPEKFYLNASIYQETILNKRELVYRSSHIIAVSENTKKDIVEIYNIDPNQISVVYHGYNNIFNKEERDLIYANYILFVGQRGGYKNFNIFLSAAAKLIRLEPDLEIICVGSSFTGEEVKQICCLNLHGKIRVMSVSDQELSHLYQNAVLFVYPSIYEGFGIPILEAFSNGCPVCLSNTSCFPEVAGEAGEYFQPEYEDSIFNAMSNVIYNSERRKEMVNMGYERVKNFTWDKCAVNTNNIYSKL